MAVGMEESVQQGGGGNVMPQEGMAVPGGTRPEEGAAAKAAPLYNPLPLPKKKEHKALDFDYEVSDDDDYDI